MNRKDFLFKGFLVAGGLSATPAALYSRDKKAFPDLHIKSDPLPPEKVKEFVVAGHNHLDKVKLMLDEYPNILFASWDWGNGDFETALEGAGHMGRKDIADYLIRAGARPNIFVLAMLGKTNEVKSILSLYPELINSKGPHGFTLLYHAQKGGEESKELFDYFGSMGLKEMNYKIKD